MVCLLQADRVREKVYVKRKIEFGRSENSLLINGVKCSVAKADDTMLNMWYVMPKANGEYLVKLMLVRQPSTDLPQMSDMEAYSSHINAKLGMIALMRQEFGNVFDPADYQNRIAENIGSEIVDFDELEEKIKSGEIF